MFFALKGAAPGRPDPGAASCTGRIVGANNGGVGGAMAKSNGRDTTTASVNPQMEAVRTYGPGRYQVAKYLIINTFMALASRVHQIVKYIRLFDAL